MDVLEPAIRKELATWEAKMQKKPTFLNKASKGIQNRINRAIPEKVHKVMTNAIKHMTRAVVTGSEWTSSSPSRDLSFTVREQLAREKINTYRNTAATEGAITGAGGFLLGLADFPIWLSLKIKMLFEIASAYGIDVRDLRERIFILHIFQLAFSSVEHRNRVFQTLKNWKSEKENLPKDINQFDWRTFQQEYRDYIDVAKLLQLVPGIGAVVGAYVNHRLTEKLGVTAMNAYRMRWFENDIKG
jgi:uncharacterized protein (DUF697 family)